MKIRQGFEEKSRLGRLLINRGYLSEIQLEEGLRLQHETGQRLGEVFIQSGWITERELHRVLKHQSRYRNAAALVTMAVLPFQPLVSFAAGSTTTNDSRDVTDAGQLYERSGLSPLNDDELAGVAGQGDQSLLDRIANVSAMAGSHDGSGEVDPDVVDPRRQAGGVPPRRRRARRPARRRRRHRARGWASSDRTRGWRR